HAPVFEAMIAHGLVFDALVLPRHLPRLARVLERHPALPVVVDHAAKPRIAQRDLAGWRVDLGTVASFPQATCKLSGLLTEARPGDGLPDLMPVVEALLASFGPQRLLWGSDWPVVNLAGGYDRWMDATREALAALDEDARAAILGGNAARVYRRR
ncbi:MAG TPA: amidohydrolase family protein, partial [Casimicrobiaceae bacterium]|nr:amidohydrolase family protein [Casimicrobiaceae bacterium]